MAAAKDRGAAATAAPVNPNIFQLEAKRKAILGHQQGEGSRCLKCDCPGLDLHYWRKICKNCSHKMDDHDVIEAEEDHGQLIIGRLFDVIPTFEEQKVLRSISETSEAGRARRLSSFDKQLAEKKSMSDAEVETDAADAKSVTSVPGFKPVEATVKKSAPISQYNVTFEKHGAEKDTVVEYTWVPTSDRILVEKYFSALPEEERPISGTAGALDRRQKLQYQLPYHDSHAAAARSIKTDADRELHTKFIKTIKEKVVGVGQLIEWTEKVTKLFKEADAEAGRKLEEAKYGRCRKCGVQMKAGEVGVVTDHGPKGEIWHPNCFRCFTCQQRLVDMLYFYKDNEYYCGRHFGDTMYPRCAGCDELIFSKEYTFAESKNWHFDHFCCFGCDKELGGHRYMVRDEQPFCFDCYMQKFARTCQACRNKIAPDQQRISYKDLHWHAEGKCFQCKKCRKVLLNQKFIIKNEEVFCSSDCKNRYFAAKR